MTISSVETDNFQASGMSFDGLAVVKTPGNTDNNGNHNGWYKGDCEGNEEDINQENPFPDNNQDENIENEIESSLVVIGSEKNIYYAKVNEYIYINIHISNPDNFEILSFTLNGKKYSSYMFEEGSNMETIILKYNVGKDSGIQEYTIDAIKYIDGSDIKDVIMDGDKTILAGINIDNQVGVSVSNKVVDTNLFSFDVSITDADELLTFSEGSLKAVIYDGENLVATKDLSIGKNTVKFENLCTSTLYQYAIVGYYDDLSGSGFGMNVLYKDAFYTEAVVLFDDIVVSKKVFNILYCGIINFKSKIENLSL